MSGRESTPWCVSDNEPVATDQPAISLISLPGIPAIRPGDDLARILGDALEAAKLQPRA
jgi:hypothetical protein